MNMEYPVIFKDPREQRLLELIMELCKIPAPSGHEMLRSEFCRRWLTNAGCRDVMVDSALNVMVPYNLQKQDMVVIVAHMDTVFPDMEPMSMKIENGCLYCPGAGDDTASLGALLLLAERCIKEKPDTEYGILFAAVSGEEGYGNLRGTRAIMERYGGRIKEFISLDHGSFDSIVTKAVGSHRYKVVASAQGGHSYGCFGNTNAIHILSMLITELYKVQVPELEGFKTTYNVGLISGGTSINTIAAKAEMHYEYRSDNSQCLHKMKEIFEGVIKNFQDNGYDISVELLGERPCSGDMDKSGHDRLLKRINDIYSENTGSVPKEMSGSTDCNIPLSMGIPAATVGTYKGKGAHTRQEYFELSSLPLGLKIADSLLDSYVI
jgi:acetylornithine deacetylase/succinyl-diaminopimelate desuccinylase-like protein